MWPFKKKKKEPDEPPAEAEGIAATPASEGSPQPAEVAAAADPPQPEPAVVDDGGRPAIPVFGGALAPIDGVVRQLVEAGEEVDFSQSGVVRISKRPMGTDAYAVRLFSPITEETIARYEAIHSASIPGAYRDVLLAVSGADVFGLDLYGVPPSMAQNPPLLDRSRSQPLDIATANRSWRWAFTPDPAGLHFGSSPWSDAEQVGYFLFSDGSVRGFLRGRPKANPEPVRQSGSWPSMEAFLAEELERCQRLFPEREERLAQLFAEVDARPKRARWKAAEE